MDFEDLTHQEKMLEDKHRAERDWRSGVNQWKKQKEQRYHESWGNFHGKVKELEEKYFKDEELKEAKDNFEIEFRKFTADTKQIYLDNEDDIEARDKAMDEHYEQFEKKTTDYVEKAQELDDKYFSDEETEGHFQTKRFTKKFRADNQGVYFDQKDDMEAEAAMEEHYQQFAKNKAERKKEMQERQLDVERRKKEKEIKLQEKKKKEEQLASSKGKAMTRHEKEMGDYIYQFEADIFNDSLIENPKSYNTGELKNDNGLEYYQEYDQEYDENYGTYDIKKTSEDKHNSQSKVTQPLIVALASSALLLTPMGKLSKVILNPRNKQILSGIASKAANPMKQANIWMNRFLV